MKSLKIAVDARPLSQPVVGITRYTFELLQRLLVDSPHEWFLYLDRPSIHSLPDLPNVHIRAGNCQRNTTSTIFAQWFFPRWAKQDRVDVFWSPRHHLPLLLPKRIKSLLTVHDLVWKIYPETMSYLGRWLERALMPPSLARAQAVISVSQATQLDLQKFFPACSDKLTVVRSGLSYTPATAKLDVEKGPYFLFVGTLEPRKNLPRLLGAFAQVVKTNDAISLVLVGGEGWGQQGLVEIIDELGLVDRVKLTARVSEQELAGFYANARALVMPSLYEGFGLPLLEAMGHGVPVISSNFGAMKEIAGDAGLLVDPYSEQQLATAMIEMLTDEIHTDLSIKATARAALFDWDNSAKAVLEIIEQM
jgi:glycosyltransferase involved in cell wall biosynthesis